MRNLKNLLETQSIGESRLATYWEVEPGIFYAASKSTDRTVESIGENVALVKSLNQHKPVKLIIQIAKSKVPDKATRAFAAKELPLTYSAMAMITSNKLAGFIINLIYGLKKPPIPIKSFSTFEEAYNWIAKM